MTTQTTMLAAVAESYDGPISLQEIARPVPSHGEVLVRIHASGTNPLDTKIRAGNAPHAQHPLPAVLGMDLAGLVESVGPGVEDFAAGDEVYGFTGGVGGIQGSNAEFAAVDAKLLARKPTNLSMREAAVLPLVVITAWEGLIHRAKIRAGQTVLVQGGAGGVGNAAVQIALAYGARVYATGLGDDLEYIKSLGAVAIDGTSDVQSYVDDLTDGKGFDVVYDTGGGALLDASFKAVKRFGHVVSCLGWGMHALAPLSFKQATYSGVFTLHALLANEGRENMGVILSAAAGLAESGQLIPRLDHRTYSLKEVGAAYDAIIGRNGAQPPKGKIAISIIVQNLAAV